MRCAHEAARRRSPLHRGHRGRPKARLNSSGSRPVSAVAPVRRPLRPCRRARAARRSTTTRCFARSAGHGWCRRDARAGGGCRSSWRSRRRQPRRCLRRARRCRTPRQMSGVPLPTADLPAGTMTVRVIQGSMDKPIAGITWSSRAARGRRPARRARRVHRPDAGIDGQSVCDRRDRAARVTRNPHALQWRHPRDAGRDRSGAREARRRGSQARRGAGAARHGRRSAAIRASCSRWATAG